MTVNPRRLRLRPMLLTLTITFTATACGERPEEATPTSSPAIIGVAADEPEISVVPVPEVTEPSLPPGELPETVKTLPPRATLPDSPFPYRRVEGDFDFERILLGDDPLRMATINIAPPTSVSIATNGPAREVPPVAAGSTVTLSYQLYSWNSDEFYDGTPAGERVDVPVGANGLPAALDLALTWSGPNERLIVVLPPRSPGLPNYVPADLAYYAVIDVFAVRTA